MISLNKIQATRKTGQETLIYNDQSLNFSLLDFWKWNTSDLLSNTTRGRFAEFIVTTTTNVNIEKIRDEWSAFDMEIPERIKIEVKSTAYIQSWFQRKLSPISFSMKVAYVCNPTINKQEEDKAQMFTCFACFIITKNKLLIL